MSAAQLRSGVAAPPASPRLRGRVLLLARIVWVVISLATAGFMLLSLITNVVLWSRATLADCPDEACQLDTLAQIHTFGSMLGAGLYYGAGQAVEMLPWIIAGAIIFWRKSDDPFALLFSLMLSLVGVFIADGIVQEIVYGRYPSLVPAMNLLNTLGGALLVIFYRFPDGRFVPGQLRWVAVAWVAMMLGTYFLPGTPFDYNVWPAPLPVLVRMAFALSVAGSCVYRYRRTSSPVERQQLKWLVASITFITIVYSAGLFIYPLRQPGNMLINLTMTPMSWLSWALFPVALLFALLRYRLWDIDLVIRRTLTYAALTALLALVYFSSILLLQALVDAFLGGRGGEAVTVLSTLVIAVLARPLYGRIQRGIDRRFYRGQYNSERALAQFAAGARDEVELAQLSQRLQAVVDETMQPASLSLWIKPAPTDSRALTGAAFDG